MGLLVEMELEGLGEFLFRVSRRGVFFAETDKFLSYVAVLFLLFHPGLGGKLRWHPKVATEEVNRGPFETFGLMDGGKG